MEEGVLTDFKIDLDRCQLCKKCLEGEFCFQKLFDLAKNGDSGEEIIVFNKKNMNLCQNCLKCVSECPFNAIIPIIIPEDKSR